MWCKILLLSSIQLIILNAHPLGSPDTAAMWGLHLSEMSDSPTENELYRIFGLDNNKDNYYQQNKRAFTLLSRWRPFSNLARNNNPSIREQNRQIFNDLDIETRAMFRPIGQPLRWG